MPLSPITLILAICTTAHYIITAVMALFARHRVKYLSIAWVMGIFAFSLLGITIVTANFSAPPSMLHPGTLALLMAACFLQSIYPLSIPMPAFLQWRRMWRYATPAILVILAYLVAIFLGMPTYAIQDFADLQQHFLSLDVLFRMLCLGISVYYIINILRLPRKMSKANVPTYLKAYTTMLGFNALLYVVITFLPFNKLLNIICLSIFTLLNLYLCLRALESMALELPKPKPTLIEHEPEEAEIRQSEYDFNEANQKRFERVEHWMQHHQEQWRDNTFGRDILCRETGFNRHLLLQCIRSQGYNNVHEYINSYRIKEVKRLIQSGQATTLTECLTAGFGAIKTLRSCFEREEGQTVDNFLDQHLPRRRQTTTNTLETEQTTE